MDIQHPPSSATCHPDRTVMGRGLCSPCYQRHHRAGTLPQFKTRRDGAYKDAKRGSGMMTGHRFAKYGIDVEMFDTMYASHDGRCFICDKPFVDKTPGQGARKGTVTIDHDHATGKTRGLLCRNCNAGLGMFQDNVALLQEAAGYLAVQSVAF
jgi:hypothetical protein